MFSKSALDFEPASDQLALTPVPLRRQPVVLSPEGRNKEIGSGILRTAPVLRIADNPASSLRLLRA